MIFYVFLDLVKNMWNRLQRELIETSGGGLSGYFSFLTTEVSWPRTFS